MIDRAIDLLQLSIPLGCDEITIASFNAIRRWGLDLRSDGFERLLKFLLYEAPKLQQTPGLTGSRFWEIPANLHQEAVAFLANSVPKTQGWGLDTDAPESRYIHRWVDVNDDHIAASVIDSAMEGLGDEEKIRRKISTTLFSLPFELSKEVLEHPFLFPSEMRKRRFDFVAGVVGEREKRRKAAVAAAVGSTGGVGGMGSGDGGGNGGLGSPGNGVGTEKGEEESVVSTYGHGSSSGIEVVRRRKGERGRVLWKVGGNGRGRTGKE